MSALTRLERGFFVQDTLTITRKLLGQCLVRIEKGQPRLAGFIIETEAYIGTEDLGCHARAGRTKRNSSMWGPPGHLYVYFTYGMHWMLNIVTEQESVPAATLIRALLPYEGIEVMLTRRRNRPRLELTNGPAKLCQALNIDSQFDGYDICMPDSNIFIERYPQVPEKMIITGPRVGLYTVPEPWKSIPWGFRVHSDFYQQFITALPE